MACEFAAACAPQDVPIIVLSASLLPTFVESPEPQSPLLSPLPSVPLSNPPNGFGVPRVTLTMGAPGSGKEGCSCTGGPFSVTACCAHAAWIGPATIAAPASHMVLRITHCVA